MTIESWVPENTFALRLRIMRAVLGLSVEEIAERCAVAPATWSKWERGSQPRGLVRTVEAIVKETGIDRDWLMFGGTWPSRLPDGISIAGRRERDPGLASAGNLGEGRNDRR